MNNNYENIKEKIPYSLIEYLQKNWIWSLYVIQIKTQAGTKSILRLAEISPESVDRMRSVTPFEMYKNGLLVVELIESSLNSFVSLYEELKI